MSIYRSPAVALMPDLTPKPLRSKANAVINLMGTFGGIFTLVMISVLKPSVSGSYKPLFFAIVGFMFICITVLLITIRERKLAKKIGIYDVDENRSDASKTESKMDPAVKRSLVFLLISIVFWFFAYNAVSTAFSRYTTAVWGDTTDEYSKYLMSATITATLAFFPIGLLSSRLGRKKVILGGIVIMAASFFAGFFFHSVTVSAYFVFAFVGIGWAAINVNSYPMVVEMSRGSDVGKYTGIYYFFSMAAQIVTPIFSGFLIEKLSIGYRILFPYAAFFSAAAFVTMLFVRHGDSKPDAGSAAEAEEDA
ncbi:hypothetical protein SDC9_119788 [bioreactor metagenome]|uniref:Major facilitator superfamily (MFS) profile domain-containing protein n=1 Tax=bioreactor metagenome TaxID=1076179 RepID=A0A645C596_9ZZZZ